MFTLFHHPFCPQSRFIRLAIGEHGLDVRPVTRPPDGVAVKTAR